MRVLIIFCFFLGCKGWLSDYFNTGGDNYLVFKNDAIMKLSNCSWRAVVWEEAIRERKIEEAVCMENDVMEGCVYEAYMDPVAEYIKLLVEDSKKLCKKKENLTWILVAIAAVVALVCLGVLNFRMMYVREGVTMVWKCTEEEKGFDVVEHPLKC